MGRDGENPVKRSLICLLVLLAAGIASAEVTIEGETSVKEHHLVILDAKGAEKGASYTWAVWPRLSPRQVKKHGGCLVFTAPPGKYVVTMTAYWLSSEKTIVVEEAEAEVIIGDAPPPGPGPDPKPGPDDELTKALKVAFALDTGPDKVKHAKALAALYRQAPAALDKVKTAGELQTALKTAAESLLPASAIPETRKAVSVELRAVLPKTASEVLTDEHKNRSRSLFGRLSVSLEALK